MSYSFLRAVNQRHRECGSFIECSPSDYCNGCFMDKDDPENKGRSFFCCEVGLVERVDNDTIITRSNCIAYGCEDCIGICDHCRVFVCKRCSCPVDDCITVQKLREENCLLKETIANLVLSIVLINRSD